MSGDITQNIKHNDRLRTFTLWKVKIIVAYRHHMVTYICVNIGLDNGLVPDGTNPLPEPMLTCHHKCSVTLIWEQFHKCLWTKCIHKVYPYITPLKSIPHLPGVNELRVEVISCSQSPSLIGVDYIDWCQHEATPYHWTKVHGLQIS